MRRVFVAASPAFLVSVPFVFALVRAARTGYDLRYLWVALASLCGAMAIMAVARPYSRKPSAAVALSAGGFVAATLLGVLAAWLLGSALGLAMVVVVSAFSFCFAAGCLLHLLARR